MSLQLTAHRLRSSVVVHPASVPEHPIARTALLLPGSSVPASTPGSEVQFPSVPDIAQRTLMLRFALVQTVAWPSNFRFELGVSGLRSRDSGESVDVRVESLGLNAASSRVLELGLKGKVDLGGLAVGEK
eukprot:3025314-Rhodomonas_salina.1